MPSEDSSQKQIPRSSRDNPLPGQRTVRRIPVRLLPYLFVLYIIGIRDRVFSLGAGISRLGENNLKRLPPSGHLVYANLRAHLGNPQSGPQCSLFIFSNLHTKILCNPFNCTILPKIPGLTQCR